MTITFHVSIESWGSPMDVAEVMTDEEYWSHDIDTNPLPANRIWESVTVADEQAKEQWLEAKRQWLIAAWTPNQYASDDRYAILSANRTIMKEAESTMETLSV